MSRLLFPPPPITISGDAFDQSSQSYRTFSPSSSSSSSTSIIIVIIVIASAVLISASLYLLLRFLSRQFHRTFSTQNPVDNLTKSPLQDELLHSLPLFTFAAVNKKAEAGDCAVCLSKFEPTDQLRLLPLCCHAFHADCIDTWLSSSQTCPLCRSTVAPTDDDVQRKIGDERSNSFRIQIGSVSRRQRQPEAGQGLRSYSIGSFEYVVDDGFEVPVEATHHRREISTCSPVDKDSTPVPAIPGENLTPEVNGSQSWLRDYVDRFSSSFSTSHSFRSSGRFFTGSSRRSDTVVPEDIESNDVGEEISELFRWISGV